MKRFVLILLVSGLLISQIGCNSSKQSSPASGDSGSAPSGGGESIFTAPGNPLDVSVALDEASSVTQVIPASGGSMSATGADGARYTLVIPPKALAVDTEIRMTPVSTITGLPFSGGLGGAVKLEPDGLTFDEFVTLEIEPAKPIPLENQVMFGFEGNGEDLYLALPSPDNQKIQVLLQHFSGAGVGSGISAEKAGVMQRMADRAEARISGQVGEYLQNLRQGENPDINVLLDAMNEFYNSVVSPRLKASMSESGTCKDGDKAIQTYLEWERQRQLLGVAPENNDGFLRLAVEVLPVVAKKCFDEQFDRCANKHQIPGIVMELLSWERQAQLLGAYDPASPAAATGAFAEVRAYGENLLQKCYRWELEFESAGSFDAGDGMMYDSRVKAKVPLKAELPVLSMVIYGSSALINEDFTFKIPDCNVTGIRGGGEFVVHTLSWETELRKNVDGEMESVIKDFVLKYFPGNTSESASAECPAKYEWDEATSFSIPSGPWWTATFMSTHYKEVDGGEGQPPVGGPMSLIEGGIPISTAEQAYIAKNWTVYEAELMATKEWEGGSDLDPDVFEGGEFRLLHKPENK